MEICEEALLAAGEKGSARAVMTFPALAGLSNSTLLASWRCGSTKDSEDESVEVRSSADGGRTWNQPTTVFGETRVNGVRGTSRVVYFTEVEPAHVLAACLWIDRETFPGKPLFNPVTEGCLPMRVLLADSFDWGTTWGPWREVEMPADIGPLSLTNPILKFPDGTLAISIETNKNYEDPSKWMQRVTLRHSRDMGKTWSAPLTASQDPTGRIFHWDQRAAVASDGRLGAFLWIYDSSTHTYLNIRRRISSDGGRTWSPAEDLGFADQPAHPAILPDGRTVLAWVDRFRTGSIRARLAESIDAPFDANTEVCIYSHRQNAGAGGQASTGDCLVEQGRWSYGLPFAEALPDGDVLVVYYAGTPDVMSIHSARLHV
jgi:hypothetical protein